MIKKNISINILNNFKENKEKEGNYYKWILESCNRKWFSLKLRIEY